MTDSRDRSKKTKVAVLIKLMPQKLGSMEDWLNQFVSKLSGEYEVTVATYGPCHPLVRRGLADCNTEWHDLSHIEGSFHSARAFMKAHADVAHLSLFAPRSLAVIAALSVRSTRTIFQDCYSSVPDSARGSLLSRTLDHVTFRRTEKVVAVSRFVAERIGKRFGVKPPVLEVVYNGVDVDRFQIQSLPSTCTGTICVAALIPEKGVDNLIRAFAHPALVGEELTICGDGPQRLELETLAATLGIAERVRFLGLRDDVQHLVGRASLAVHPAVWDEAFGLTIAEAMAAGRPVVGCTVGAVSELIEHGITGLLTPPSDPAALALAIQRLLADSALRDSMGRNGRLRVEQQFSMKQWVDQHVRIVDEVARVP